MILNGSRQICKTWFLKEFGHLRTYLCLGGMPEIVLSFIETRDLNQARVLQKKLLAVPRP